MIHSTNIDSISPKELERDLAKVLRELLSGVAWLHGWTVEPAKGIERAGNQPVRTHRRAGANLSTPESGRIVRALLAPENVGQRWTQRDMVTHFAKLSPPVTAPSLALVNKIVQHLRDQAFVEQLPNRGFRVRDYEGLLQAWSGAYRLDRHA